MFKEWCETNFCITTETFNEQIFNGLICETNFPSNVTVKTKDGSRLPDDCLIFINGRVIKDVYENEKEEYGNDAIGGVHHFPAGKLMIQIRAENVAIPPIVVEVDEKKENYMNDPSVFLLFKKDLDYFLSSWKPENDLLLAQSIGETKIDVEADKDKLNSLHPGITKWRSHLITKFNDILSNNLKKILDKTFHMSYLMPIAHCIFPEIKFKIIDKSVSKNLNGKMMLCFNRTSASLMKTSPESVNAHSLFDQMINQVNIESIVKLKSRIAPWVANLAGEGAIDAGGPGREVFTEMCEEIFLQFNHLFIQSPATRNTNQMCEFLPDPKCPKSRMIYAGALVGLSFVTQSPQPFKFHPIVWSFLTGKDVTAFDIMKMDSAIEKLINSSGKKKLNVFSVTGEEVNLSKNDPDEEVDEETFKKVVLDFRIRELTHALKNLRCGFEIIMEKSCRHILTPTQLKYLICGPDEITAKQFISKINFINEDDYSRSFEWVVEQLTPDERAQLLKFVTGRVSLPVAGSGESVNFNVSFDKRCEEHPPFSLPVAATCSSTIDIPRYPTKEIMLERIRVAIKYGGDMTLDTNMVTSLRVFE
jgi:hypothetical protein